jgi:pimeloyl-ACP methyl ester carboxylesterase
MHTPYAEVQRTRRKPRVAVWHARPMPPGETVELAVPGSTLRVDRWPAAAPTVVMLHSGVTDRRSWYAVADSLDGAADVIAYDRRGYGTTEVGELEFRHVDDLLEVIKQQATGPVFLVGNSMGGLLALDFTLAHPDLVAGLLLLAPAISGAPEPTDVDAASMILDERAERAWADDDKAEAIRLEIWMWLDGPTGAEGRVTGPPRRLAEDMFRQIVTQDADDHAGDAGVDAWSQLETIGVPTIVGCGELDVPFFVDRSRLMADRFPHGRFVLLPGVAHLPGLEQPETVAALVSEMLSGAQAGA